jgi:hypothetical protein
MRGESLDLVSDLTTVAFRRVDVRPLPGQLRNRAREGRLEVDRLHPGRGHDDPDHAVVARTHLGLPLVPGLVDAPVLMAR